MMSLTGTPESGPLKTGSTVVDYTTGYAAAFAIAGALFHRSRTGEGQAIDLAMLEVAMSVMSNEVTRAVTNGEQPPLHGNGSGVGRYVSNTFRCKEGVIMIAARSQNLRGRFWKSMDREDIPKDPRFATDALARRNMKELEAEVQKTLLTRTAREWEAQVQPRRRAGHAGAVAHGGDQRAADRGARLHQALRRRPGGRASRATAYRPCRIAFRGTPAAITKRAPMLGEHTDSILASLGFSPEEIAGLREKKIV